MQRSAAIAITGMSWTTPLGDDLEGVWTRLLAAETGLVAVPHRARLRNNLAALVPGVDWQLRPAERLRTMATAPLRRAIAASGRTATDPGMQLVIGTSLGSFLDDDPPATDLHSWADQLAREFGFARPPMVVSTACCSGSDAILLGAELVRARVADCCICGGVDIVTASKREAHSALGTMSPTRLRPFDVRHDGTLLGEGAGFMALERAAERCRPLAMLLGSGSANDAAGMTAPDPNGQGAQLAIRQSLAGAGLETRQIGVINAHASGTVLNDETECKTFREVFGGNGYTVVFGTKGNFGHGLGATGALEAIAVVQALLHQVVPRVLGLEHPMDQFPLPLVQGESAKITSEYGLDLTLGFGGFNTSLVFGACQ
jgi:3-oxoacyl-[acyl-carrier-protein] synthase II